MHTKMHALVRKSSFSKAQGLRETGSRWHVMSRVLLSQMIQMCQLTGRTLTFTRYSDSYLIEVLPNVIRVCKIIYQYDYQ